MDIYCANCGEPWDINELTAEGVTFDEFKRAGCRAFGTRCANDSQPGILARMIDERAAMVRAIYEIMGDDMDGAASMFDDFCPA